METMAHHMVHAVSIDSDQADSFGDLHCGDGPKGEGAVRNELGRRHPDWQVVSATFADGRWDVLVRTTADTRNAFAGSYISGKRLASVRASLRRRGLDPASARAGDPGPGCYLHTILDRAQMRGERSAVEAAIMETLDWDDPRSPVHVCTGPNCCK